MESALREKDLWSVVLAGGDAERLRPFVQRWLGRHKPKQYCIFIGTRSMFRHTVDRSDRIVAPERRVAVIAREHQHEAWPQFSSRTRGMWLLRVSYDFVAWGCLMPIALIPIE
jgi:mannose-1-phosphate guanylyltransferase